MKLHRCVPYTRTFVIGPYDHQIVSFASVAQLLLQAIRLRYQYGKFVDDDINAAVINHESNDTIIHLALSAITEQNKKSTPDNSKAQTFSPTPVTGNVANINKNPLYFDEDEWMYKTVEGVVVPHEVHQIPRLP